MDHTPCQSGCQENAVCDGPDLISFQLLRSTCCSLVKSDKTPLMIATFPGKRAANKDFKEKKRRGKKRK